MPPESKIESAADEQKQREMFENILRRIERGDTSVVSEIYWMQHLGLFPPKEKK
jgi:hypothetical protein